jgi:hypothetical protein
LRPGSREAQPQRTTTPGAIGRAETSDVDGAGDRSSAKDGGLHIATTNGSNAE